MISTKHIPEFISRWLPPLTIMVVIFIISSFPTLPQIGESEFDVILKKLAHVTEYTLLFSAWIRAINWGKNSIHVRSILLSVILTVIYSFTDEYHQSFVPGRHSSIIDVGFDILGIVIGMLFQFFRHYRNKLSNEHLLSQSQS